MKATTTVSRLFLSHLFATRQAWLLPVAAFAVVSTLGLSVAGGIHFFFTLNNQAENETAGMYMILAALAGILLIMPIASLAGAAAKLLARRRDERLSSLRLLGASSSLLRTLAVAEASVLAVIGSLIGVLGYLVLMPVAGLLHFAGGSIGISGMWLGTPGMLAVLTAIIVIGTVSSITGLRSIEITPLGVRTRQHPARLHWLRIVAAVVLLVAAQLFANIYGAGGIMFAVIMVLAAFAVPMLALHFIGPWLIAAVTRWRLRRAKTAQSLVAARAVLESPQQAWAQIGGVALTTYIGVVAGAGVSLANMGMDDAAASMSNAEIHLMTDLRTGVLLTMVIAFLLSACSVAITQTAQVLDRATLYNGLRRIGMSFAHLQTTRRKAVFGPLSIVLVFTLLSAVITAFPLLGIAVVASPLSMLVISGCCLLGVGLIWGGVQSSVPTLRAVTAD